jgi:CubicO group peptidase (beta-lactamase class C family)
MYRVSDSFSRPHYSNLGFSLLGRCLGHLANTNYESYVVENILHPLKMNSSGWGVPTDPGIKARMATGVDGDSPGDWENYLWDNPNGGLYSTPRDMMNYLANIFAHTDLTTTSSEGDATLNDFLEIVAVEPDGQGAWGAPWELQYSNAGQDWIFGKAGEVPGFSSQLSFFPAVKLGVFTVALSSSTAESTVWATPILEKLIGPVKEILWQRQPAPELPPNVNE